MDSALRCFDERVAGLRFPQIGVCCYQVGVSVRVELLRENS